jgi:threonine synthase
VISLGEGNTPVVEKSGVHYKLEGMNPTGSFKDRGTKVVVSKAIEEEMGKLHICSSGNAAISLALYGTSHGLEVTCHVPQQTSTGKKQLISSLGADIEEYQGTYEDVYYELKDQELDGWNVTPGIEDLSMQGYEKIATEAVSHGIHPDKVVVPCGNGTNLSGIWKGFQSTKVSPEMIGVQIEGAAPIKKALENEKSTAVVEEPMESKAEGIVASESFHCEQAVKAIQQSDGTLQTVSEKELQQAMAEIVGKGILCEPSCAVVEPVVQEMKGQVLAVVTGSGLKNYDEIKDMVEGGQKHETSASL